MLIYELNTRAHCQAFDQISFEELTRLARLGFNAVWLMGVWRVSEGAKRVSKVISEEFEGSPYAISSYQFSPALGGLDGFQRLTERAHGAGLAVLVDFIPNHLALDSDWIEENPALFIRSDPRVRKQSPGDYFLHRCGEVIAFGKDPYFPPWCDTAQLDYTSVELRRRMIDVLKWITRFADGVRCDMAMLVLRDQIRRQWFPLADREWFDRRMPSEFWEEAIQEVKAARPDFLFLAEAYWDTEEYLLNLGFDLCYEKKLYDGLVGRDPAAVLGRLQRDPDTLGRSLFFVENHDEARAAAVFTRAENLAAAALILSLPGSALIHEGQIEGFRERLPVQLTKRREEEPDQALASGYEKLLRITSREVFRRGTFRLVDLRARHVIAMLRQLAGQVVAYFGLVGGLESFSDASLDLSPLAAAVDRPGRLRLTNLMSSESVVVEKAGASFRLTPRAVFRELADDQRFLVVAVAPD